MRYTIQSEDLKQIVKNIQTPAYVFDTDVLADRVAFLKQALGERVRLCFAMKANPALTSVMGHMVDKFEVCSPGEFRICRREKIAPEKIVLSGLVKCRDDLREQVGYLRDSGVYTIESLQQLQLLEEEASRAELTIGVLIRITGGNQFGVDIRTASHMIEKRESYPHLHFRGIQQYTGTQKKKLSRIRQELEELDACLTDWKSRFGYEAEELEYGPGFYIPYFRGEEEQDDAALIKEFTGILQKLKYQGPVTLEMGRFLTADCGVYFTSVLEKKESRGQHYALVDGGIHHLNYYGQMMAMKVPPVTRLSAGGELLQIDDRQACKQIKTPEEREAPAKREEPMQEAETVQAGENTTWHICGSLCTVNDLLVKNLELPGLEEGDILAFGRTGAYAMTESMFLFLSRDLPQIALWSEKEGLQILREHQATDLINSPFRKFCL